MHFAENACQEAMERLGEFDKDMLDELHEQEAEQKEKEVKGQTPKGEAVVKDKRGWGQKICDNKAEAEAK